MKLTLPLTYNLAEGWLAPHIRGLWDGIAVASGCSRCDTASFPPQRICPVCRATVTTWRELSGRATVLYRTTGSDGDVALVRFDGAVGAALARVDLLPPGVTRGMILPASGDTPALILGPEDTE